MLTAIDHVVIVVRDLAAAQRDYAALGFTVLPGGNHADGQTHNALVAFADGSYLELLAFVHPDQPSMHTWYARLAEGEGIEDCCLASDDLAADAARWSAAGLAVAGPTAGGRQRPDGTELRWQTVRLTQAVGDMTLPFIIQDVTPRGLRVASGAAAQHTVAGRGITGMQGIRVAVADLAAATQRYTALLGHAPASADATTARFTLGSQWIELHAAGRDADAAAALGHHGAGPYAIVLGSDGAEPSPVWLAVGTAHGAHIGVGPSLGSPPDPIIRANGS